MKKFLKSLWTIFCIVLLFLFIISCFSAFIAPSLFSYITLFTLAFPYLFLLTLITAIINFYINKKLSFVTLLCMPPALFNLSHTLALNFPKKFSDKKDEKTFRVMTWNVQDFVDLSPQSDVRSKMLTIIHQKDPDVLCIQELTNVEGGRWRISVRKELDSLGYKYCFFSNDWVTSNKHDAIVTRGVAIFSKTPVTDSGRIEINKVDGITEHLIYVNTEFNKRLVRIYTAHLASYQLYRDTDRVKKDIYEITYNRKRDIQYKLREVEQLHQQEAEIISDTVSKAVFPVIYCGDMNTTPCSYPYRLLKNDFNDAFLEEGSGIGATFYKILPLLRIDYCLVDKRLEVTNCTVIKQKLSDHYPVIADVKWK
ncbi:MAG TPA: endonuclease/exonuclease/phosphatase family protein [Parafilimonas sp.]|nr:endonuclease/exonuclease/phosphatase family protein [Parafilimonas sp.]